MQTYSLSAECFGYNYGRFTLDKFSEPHVSRNDSAKEVGKMSKVAPFCCRDNNVMNRVPYVMCRVL